MYVGGLHYHVMWVTLGVQHTIYISQIYIYASNLYIHYSPLLYIYMDPLLYVCSTYNVCT